jgi:hypothetical protein
MFTGYRYGPKKTDDYTEGTLIEFSHSNSDSYKEWTNVIEDIIGGITVSCNQQFNEYFITSFTNSWKIVLNFKAAEAEFFYKLEKDIDPFKTLFNVDD